MGKMSLPERNMFVKDLQVLCDITDDNMIYYKTWYTHEKWWYDSIQYKDMMTIITSTKETWWTHLNIWYNVLCRYDVFTEMMTFSNEMMTHGNW